MGVGSWPDRIAGLIRTGTTKRVYSMKAASQGERPHQNLAVLAP